MALGLGIAGYFSLSQEPPIGWGLAFCGVGALALLAAWRRGLWVLPGFAVFLIALGFLAAEVRTAYVAAPVLPKAVSTGLTAQVEQVSPHQSGKVRLILSPIEIEGIAEENTPARIRLSVHLSQLPKGHLKPGERVSLFARLLPPPGPVLPGGFDYARQVYFERIGGTGFALSDLEVTDSSPLRTWTWAEKVADLRQSVTARILKSMQSPEAGIAAALITGERGAIPEPAEDALRHAGLAHILAISGLHMALVAGALFAGLRILFSCIPALALRWPVKKWAAVGAFFGAGFYLALSGGSIATERAFLMAALVFTSVLLDRPALTLRNVALAALVVLLWSPEALLSPSFQMSFAAVTCLVAVYERGRFAFGRMIDADRSLAGRALRYVGALALTSLIAGLATAPYSAFHFNQVAVYGLIANLVALPILGALVMPMGLVSLFLMPFHLEAIPLTLMGFGIRLILAAAEFVAALPGAVITVPKAPIAGLAVITMGGLWLALWSRRVRWLGMVAIGSGLVIVVLSASLPDLLIDREGDGIAVLQGPETLTVTPGVSSYVKDIWLRTAGLESISRQGMACDAHGCVIRTVGGKRVAFGKTVGAAVEDCALADIVVSAVPLPRRLKRDCEAEFVIDRRDLWEGGAITVYDDNGIYRVETAQEARGERPWSR